MLILLGSVMLFPVSGSLSVQAEHPTAGREFMTTSLDAVGILLFLSSFDGAL
jgi:hypothetical protein